VSAPPASTPVAQATPKPASEATPPAAATSQASPPTPTPAEGARPVSALAAGALASGGVAGAGQGAAGAGSQPKRSSPMPLVLGAAAVLVVGVITIALFSGRRAPTPISTPVSAAANAAGNAADNSAIARAEAAPGPAPAADPLVTAAQAMVGDWSGNGAVCETNPLSIAFDPTSKTIRETLSNTPSVGALVGKRADGAVELRFAGDGHTEYDSVSGDTLTLGFNTGPMTYQRCAT
jgi:hypothetical protein